MGCHYHGAPRHPLVCLAHKALILCLTDRKDLLSRLYTARAASSTQSCLSQQTIQTHLQLAGSPLRCGTQTVQAYMVDFPFVVFLCLTLLLCMQSTMMGGCAYPFCTALGMTLMAMRKLQSGGHQYNL